MFKALGILFFQGWMWSGPLRFVHIPEHVSFSFHLKSRDWILPILKTQMKKEYTHSFFLALAYRYK